MEYLNRNKIIDEALRKIDSLNGDTSLIKDTDEKNKSINTSIRNKYSLSEELAIHRKLLKMLCDKLNIDYGEFIEYNEFADSCKNEESLNETSKVSQ